MLGGGIVGPHEGSESCVFILSVGGEVPSPFSPNIRVYVFGPTALSPGVDLIFLKST